MNIEIAADLIQNPNIKTVSFDIFDTLLQRPALNPDDIFVLLNEPVRDVLQQKKFNFYDARRKIESEAVRFHQKDNLPPFTLSFEQIYKFFQTTYKISNEQTQRIMALECDLEKHLLAPRSTGQQLFEAARNANKRIICVSDMYHREPFLRELLSHNGYTDVEAVYVSSDIKKRKDLGTLFPHVLEKETLAPHELLHIGDNLESDYRIPLSLGIPSVHIPSARDHFFTTQADDRHIWDGDYSPHEGLIIGFFLNRWPEHLTESTSLFNELKDMGYFGIGPILFAIAQSLRTNPAIQQGYDCIHFASRDGFLPKIAYDALNEESTIPSLPSTYLYCGRSLYHTTSYQDDPLEFFTRRIRRGAFGAEMTLGQLFDSMISKDFISAEDPRRSHPIDLEIRQGFPNLIAIFKERHAEAHRLLSEKKQTIQDYYTTALSLSEDRRAVVFDCGYNGSVSTNIMNVVDGKIDKAYLCETTKNKTTDLSKRTRTYLLLDSLSKIHPNGIMNIFEEVFSSACGPCTDFIREGNQFTPIFDDAQNPSARCTETISILQTEATAFVRDLKSRFGPYTDLLSVSTIAFATEPLHAAMKSPRDFSIRNFDQIVFPDSFYGDDRPLNQKIEPLGYEYLLRTPFVDPKVHISTPASQTCPPSLRIGVHLHIYHMDLAPDFVRRLADWPVPFDLFISVCSTLDEQAAKILFAPLLKRNAKNLTIRTHPNRGRDVSAWIIGFGKELSQYDLAAHVHTKRSPHFPWGDRWRDYLLDNTISREAFVDIQAHFQNDVSLGVVFPPAFDEVFTLWGIENLPHIEDIDRKNAENLLSRMGIHTPMSKHNTHFSVGTMLWYRPDALSPLVDLGLTFEDFEPEPLQITGSLAHAIERVPGLVAAHGGYTSRAFIRQDQLLERFHTNRLRAIDTRNTTSIICFVKIKLGVLLNLITKILLLVMPRGSRRYQWARKVADRLNLPV